MKTSQRSQALARLKHFPKDQKKLANQRLIAQVLAHPSYREAKTVATYLSLPHEVATSALIAQAVADGKRVVVPKVMGQGEMVFVTYDETNLVSSGLGIWEPNSCLAVPKEEIDLIHVPGLVFDSRGYRLGYGGGFYDRYLADYSGQTLATLYGFQVGQLTPEPHDVPVKELVIDETAG